jgi:hypothetical protein
METQLAKNNTIQWGRWKNEKIHLIIFDLSPVNEALIQYKTKPVDGIIGDEKYFELLKYGNGKNLPDMLNVEVKK